MQKRSAGLLFYRYFNLHELQVLLVHPGGPFHKSKDAGDWSIPKGELEKNETSFQTAKREFHEETGISAPEGNYKLLTPVQLKSGKIVEAYYLNASPDCTHIQSNMASIEFPYKSGKYIEIPEVDKAEWFNAETAKEKINQGQVPLIKELEEKLNTKKEDLL